MEQSATREEGTTAQAEGTGDQTPSRPKRSRTGCLTCRTRRRKCDEGKPTCQNCITKSLECKYPATFQFLGKNNFTSEVATNVKYTNLRFMGGDAEQKSREEGDHEAGENKTTPSQTSQTSPLNSGAPIEILNESNSRSAEAQKSPEGVIEGPPTDSYEFALHGLLALGTANHEVESEQLNFSPEEVHLATHNTPGVRSSGSFNFGQPLQETFTNESRPSVADNLPTWQVLDHPERPEQQLSPERVLELLKHYRYDIAPWLDIGDTKQSFGCEVSQLSSDNISIRYGLLALADASLSIQQPYNREDGALDIALFADLFQQRECASGTMTCALLKTLATARQAITDLDDFWAREQHTLNDGVVEGILSSHIESSPLASSIHWLLARLQLSFALTGRSSMGAPFTFAPVTSHNRSYAGSEDRKMRDSRDAVALCLEAFVFCNEDDDKRIERRYGRNRVEAWTNLVQTFEQSYNNRPQELRPIIELYPRDGKHSDDEFPTIVFTNGAAILANQLYHTGMLLLLQNKPRFSSQRSSSSPFMSVLWHARRICGIAMNNDRRECWDPCLLASFLVAARTATHQSQHTAIIGSVGSIERITSWKIPLHLNALRDEWRLAEGW